MAEARSAASRKPLNREEREAALSRFIHDECCGVLVMDQIGAVGLDLSFASHVMLMEPCEDLSLEQQFLIRARALPPAP
ncbi:F-box protein [Tetrabaena socialis]|uniref:F-box protein n=1 Tax=Tetrabaena socialis TaxID=47790 RepID=A0A2J8ACU9_9CHLO|nr:F-box protein [Tetrabaena socialis]|eukprot:PNH10337.1 F-box protein [Tetrabaena socialis]